MGFAVPQKVAWVENLSPKLKLLANAESGHGPALSNPYKCWVFQLPWFIA
jgi:hypothetical protein